MFTLQSAVEGAVFPLTLTIATMLFMRTLRPRKLWWVYLIAGFLVTCALMTLCGWLRNRFYERYPMTDVYRTVDWLKYYVISAIINMIAVAAVFLTFRLAFAGSVKTVLSALTAGYATQSIAAGIINIVLGACGQISLMQAMDSGWAYGFLLLVYAGVYVITYFLLARRYPRDGTDFADGRSLAVFAAVMLVNLVLGSVSSSPQPQVRNMYILICIGVIFCGAFVLAMQYIMYRWRGTETDNIRQREFIERQKMSYAQMKDNMDGVDMKLHDLKHFIGVLRAGGGDEVLDEIEESLDSGGTVFNTGSEALDVVLSDKSRVCRRNSIDFSVIADGSVLGGMTTLDIYSLFCNALDNAIEACERAEEDDLGYVYVNVRRNPADPGNGIIHIENTATAPVEFSGYGYPSTGKEEEGHGLGTRSILSVAEKYGGKVEFSVEGGVFNLDIALPITA